MKSMKPILSLTILLICVGCMNKITKQDNPPATSSNVPKFVKGGAKTGARGVKNIMSGMLDNISKFRQLYNEEYKDYPHAQFKVTVKFHIYYLGNVTSSGIVDTFTRNSKPDNSPFYSKILSIIDSIQFGPIDEKNDTTEVIYPLAFSN